MTDRPHAKIPGYEDLAPLKTVSPDVFISSNQDDQDVCQFVLSLSVIYNDFTDIRWALNQLNTCEPPVDERGKLTAYNGLLGGMKHHVIKLYFAIFWELFKIIRDNTKVTGNPIFCSTVRLLSPRSRAAWDDIIQFALEGNTQEPFLKQFFARIRCKTAYHYDVSEILNGYRNSFFGADGKPKMDAFVSLGYTTNSSRFYFADAAVEGYFYHVAGDKVSDFIEKINTYSQKIDNVLHEIVRKFIGVRGYSWREYRHDVCG